MRIHRAVQGVFFPARQGRKAGPVRPCFGALIKVCPYIPHVWFKKECSKTYMAEKLKIISLGGLNEIGKNLTVYEYGGDIILVDVGMGRGNPRLYLSH